MRAVVFCLELDGDGLAGRHAPGHAQLERHAGQADACAPQQGREEQAREGAPHEVDLVRSHLGPGRARDEREHEDGAPLGREVAVELPDRRDEPAHQVGTSTVAKIPATRSNAAVPPYRACAVSATRCASTGPASACTSSGVTYVRRSR